MINDSLKTADGEFMAPVFLEDGGGGLFLGNSLGLRKRGGGISKPKPKPYQFTYKSTSGR